MINKKITALFLGVCALGLAACDGGGGETSASTSDPYAVSDRTDSYVPDPITISIVGDMTDPCEGYVNVATEDQKSMDWDQTNTLAGLTFVDGGEVNGYHVYVLDNITLRKDDQFKFCFNHNWGGDFGFGGLEETSKAYADFAASGTTAEGNPDPASNIKVVNEGVYKFTYHPLYIAEDIKQMTVERVGDAAPLEA